MQSVRNFARVATFSLKFCHQTKVNEKDWRFLCSSGSWQSLVLHGEGSRLALFDSRTQLLWRESLQHLAHQRLYTRCYYRHRYE